MRYYIQYFCQVFLVFVTAVISPPEASLRMQVLTTREVELFCKMSLTPFMICLGYDLLLLLLCAAHAFLTRKLPENFNESWYVFVSVCTTSFLWMVFLPTYFTTFYAHHQAALLAFCLFVNGACTLLCLFVPKVYAIYFVDEDDMIFGTGTFTNGTRPRTRLSQVSPSCHEPEKSNSNM